MNTMEGEVIRPCVFLHVSQNEGRQRLIHPGGYIFFSSQTERLCSAHCLLYFLCLLFFLIKLSAKHRECQTAACLFKLLLLLLVFFFFTVVIMFLDIDGNVLLLITAVGIVFI